jgi:hypothetical protein
MKINSRVSFVSAALFSGHWSDTIDLISGTENDTIKLYRCNVLLEHLESINLNDKELIVKLLFLFSELNQEIPRVEDFLSNVIFKAYKLSKIPGRTHLA